jgi:hypothetical protein
VTHALKVHIKFQTNRLIKSRHVMAAILKNNDFQKNAF